MLRAGQETFASALALIRVPEKKWRFLTADVNDLEAARLAIMRLRQAPVVCAYVGLPAPEADAPAPTGTVQ